MAISSIYNTPSRVSGLNSGIDTDLMVKAAVMREQQKIDRLFISKTKLEWKQEAYSNVNSLLTSFKNTFMTSLNSQKNMLAPSNFLSKTITLQSNPFVKVTAGSAAAASNHKITATTAGSAASVIGSILNTRSAEATSAKSMYNKVSLSAEMADGVTLSTNVLDLVDSEGNSIAKDGKIEFTINGQKFEFTGGTVQDMINTVNAGDTAKVTMAYDEATKSLSIKSDVSGANSKVNVSDDTGTFFAKAVSNISRTSQNMLSLDKTLEEMANLTGYSDMFDTNGKVSFKINGETFTFGKDATIQDVMNQVNGNAAANVKMSFNLDNGQFFLRSGVSGTLTNIQTSNVSGKFFGASNGSLTGIAEGTTKDYKTISTGDTLSDILRKTGNTEYSEDTIDITVNGFDFSFEKTDTLNSMIKQINESEAGVTLSYNALNDSFMFTSKESGLISKVDISGTGLEVFGMTAGNAQGTDASITIDGTTYSSRTNTFTLDGLTYEITGNMTLSDEPVTFAVTQNTDSVVDRVKEFVSEYNKLIESLNSMLSTRTNRKYYPLTDEQKGAMSDKDVEKWEYEAKIGYLYNDAHLNKLITTIRDSVSAQVGSTGMSVKDIGIKFAKYEYGTPNGGMAKIELDENALRAALEKDPEAVSKLFTDNPTSLKDKEKFDNSGFIARISDAMTEFSSSVRSQQTQKNTEKISTLDSQIQELQYALYLKSEKLYIKYAQMEKTLGQLNSQQSWLTSQLSSL